MAKHYTVRLPDVSLTSYDIWIPYSVIGNSLGQGDGRKHSRQHELLDSEDQTSTCPSTRTKNQLDNYSVQHW